MTTTRPKAPQCAAIVLERRKGPWRSDLPRQCRAKASYLFVWGDRQQPLCAFHASGWLSQPALPPSLEAIARWAPAKAEDGWLWER